ncbi:MAG: efflux RND transporter periplasmic adaptor subunit [Burkholderiales bacterium]|jgi:RND family efflux transporter MFP subunit|nr:efflux RND transporter periplasmic adaptor subunit [Burkholderiales bacterium]
MKLLSGPSWRVALPSLTGGALLLVSAVLSAAPQLATAPVELRDVDSAYAADGVVEAVRQATIAAQLQGRVIELNVNAGDAVTKGQVLARIDEREAAQALASGEAQAARAQAELANAKVNLERTKRLVNENFVSKAALDKAQADFDAASAALAAAKAGAGQAATVKGYAVVTAPFTGVIAERTVELGDLAQPGKPMFVIYDPASLRVVADVPEDTVAGLHGTGDAASVEMPALGKSFKPKAVTVLPSADVRTHTKRVRLDLADDARGAYPGMFARAHFGTGKAKKLLIPAQAVAYRSEVAGAYVVNDKGEIRFRQLRLGERAGEKSIEVLAGLAPGERVALDPVAALAALKQR